MKKRELVRLLNDAKKYGTKAAAVAVAATLAFSSVPVETLASEPMLIVETEEGEQTEAATMDETQEAVTDAQEATQDALDSVTDTTTEGHLEDTAEGLEQAADSLEEAETLQQEVTDNMSTVESANEAFAAAMEAAKQETDAAQNAAEEAEAAKDIAISTDNESEAREAVEEAGASADAAQSAVDAAQEKVDNAQAEYDKAYAAYQEALQKAQEAQNELENAGTELEGAAEDIDEAQGAAEEFKNAADEALENVNKEGMSLILAQHDKVAEIYNEEGKTENYWAATRTLNNMIVEYYLLAGNSDVNKDSVRFGAEYDNTEFKVITDYEKDENGVYKVDENGNYIPVYTQITYTDNTKDDTGEANWIKANSDQDNRTVCVYEEQMRDENNALMYDKAGNPLMKTVVKYYNYKWNEDGTIYIVEKMWNSEDAEEIIAEVPAVDAVDPTYGYVDGNNNELTRDENDVKQVVKTFDSGEEAVAIPDENDLRGTTSTLPEDTVVKNGNTTTTTTYAKGEENTTYALGDTQVINKEGTGATSVTDYNNDRNGSKDDMKSEVSGLLEQYDVNEGYIIKIHYESLFQNKDYTIDNYNASSNFWTKLDDWFADFLGTAEYTIDVIHTEDTVEGIIGTTTADYTVTTTEVVTENKNETGKGYKSQNGAQEGAQSKIAAIVADYQKQLGDGSTVVEENGVYTIMSSDATISYELSFDVDTNWYVSGIQWRYQYEIDYTVKTTTTTTTTENKTIATQAYGAKYYNYTQTSAGTPAVPGKDAAYGTKIVWSEDLNQKLVDENSPEYKNALAVQQEKIEEYTDAANAAAEALNKVNAAQEKVDEAQEAYDNLKSDSDASWLALKAYELVLNAAKARLEAATQEAEELQAVADAAEEAYEEALASLDRFQVTDDDSDAGNDADTENGSDAGNDADTENGSDTGNDADTENGSDTGNDADTENGSDAGNDADTENGSDTGSDADTENDSTTGSDSNAGNESATGNVPYVGITQTNETPAAQTAAVGRTAGTRTAQAAEEANLTTIEDEEVPLAAEEDAAEAAEADEPDVEVIEDEEVPLAAEKENTQRTFWWWILLVIAIVTGTYFVVKYQKNKKNKAQA